VPLPRVINRAIRDSGGYLLIVIALFKCLYEKTKLSHLRSVKAFEVQLLDINASSWLPVNIYIVYIFLMYTNEYCCENDVEIRPLDCADTHF
jgi:hypothetical protein